MHPWKLVFSIPCLLGISLVAQDISNRKELYPSRYLNFFVEPDKHEIDSIIELIQFRQDDTVKVDLLISLANLYPTVNDSVLLYGKRAETLAEKLNYSKGLYRAVEVQAGHYGTYGRSDFNNAMTHHNRMVSIAEQNNWVDEIHEAYAGILNLLFFMGDFPGAMNLATRGLAQAEEKFDQGRIAYYKNLLAFIYLRQGNFEMARINYSEFLMHTEGIEDSMKIMEAKMGLGEVLLAEKKANDAILQLEPVMNYFTNRIRRYGSGSIKTEKVIYSTFVLAQAYRDAGDNAKALALCLMGFSYSDSIIFNKYDLANYYLITGSAYENLGKIFEARQVYQTGLKISLEIKHAEDVRDGYASLARIYAYLKRYDSAYHYQQLYGLMKDSIVNVRTRSEIQRINAVYDFRKKDQELEQQDQLHMAELKRQALMRNVIIVGVIFGLLLLWLIYNRYRLKEKHIMHQRFADQRTELMANFINAQNSERSRLARDIHDQVGTLLSAAKLKLSDFEESVPFEDREKIKSSISTLDMATNSLRNISHNLVPGTLSRLGLVLALEHFFNQLKQISTLKIDFVAHYFNERLSENLETNLYPIVLELANNAIRHANAKSLVIQLIRHPNKINITVEDDGIGFDYKSWGKNQTGIGLANIESRIETLKGSFDIDSIHGRGTIAMVDVPV